MKIKSQDVLTPVQQIQSVEDLSAILDLNIDDAMSLALGKMGSDKELSADWYEAILAKLGEAEKETFTLGLASQQVQVYPASKRVAEIDVDAEVQKLKTHFTKLVQAQGCIFEDDYHEVCYDVSPRTVSEINSWIMANAIPLKKNLPKGDVTKLYRDKVKNLVKNPDVKNIKSTPDKPGLLKVRVAKTEEDIIAVDNRKSNISKKADLRLSPSDKRVILKFIDRQSGDNKKFHTDGTTLDGLWMGGNDLAHWSDDKLEIEPPTGRASQTVANFIKKNTSAKWLADVLAPMGHVGIRVGKYEYRMPIREEAQYGPYKTTDPDTLEEAGVSEFEKAVILEGMARAFFVTAWANWQEYYGTEDLMGVELMEVAPKNDPAAMEAAEKLYSEIESTNDVNLADLVVQFEKDLEGEAFPTSTFGHYLAMEAMGTGVSWEDEGSPHGLEIPQVEFGYLDLDPEKYPVPEDREAGFDPDAQNEAKEPLYHIEACNASTDERMQIPVYSTLDAALDPDAQATTEHFLEQEKRKLEDALRAWEPKLPNLNMWLKTVERAYDYPELKDIWDTLYETKENGKPKKTEPYREVIEFDFGNGDEEPLELAANKSLRVEANFMEPMVEPGTWISIDGPMGGEWISADLVDMAEVEELQRLVATGPALLAGTSLADYAENSEIHDIEVQDGYSAYLSAPGYLDRTEDVVFDTMEQAWAYLEETYPEVFEGEDWRK